MNGVSPGAMAEALHSHKAVGCQTGKAHRGTDGQVGAICTLARSSFALLRGTGMMKYLIPLFPLFPLGLAWAVATADLCSS